MTQKISIVILACVVVFVSAVLSGCGSSSPTNVTSKDFTNVLTTGNTTGTGTYGSLTLSGTGTTITGTTSYNAKYVVAASSALGFSATYFNINVPAGWTYPYDYLSVAQDNVGNIQSVTMFHYTAFGSFSAYWGAFYIAGTTPPITAVSITSATRTITFNNLTMPGVLGTTNTSITLNGALKY